MTVAALVPELTVELSLTLVAVYVLPLLVIVMAGAMVGKDMVKSPPLPVLESVTHVPL